MKPKLAQINVFFSQAEGKVAKPGRFLPWNKHALLRNSKDVKPENDGKDWPFVLKMESNQI